MFYEHDGGATDPLYIESNSNWDHVMWVRFGIVDEAKRESTSDTCETLSYLYSKSFDADAQRMTPKYRRNDYSVTGINWKKENGDNQGMQDTCFSGSVNFYECQNDQEEAFVLHFDILRS